MMIDVHPSKPKTKENFGWESRVVHELRKCGSKISLYVTYERAVSFYVCPWNVEDTPLGTQDTLTDNNNNLRYYIYFCLDQ
jgi:hypothetical protein